MSSSTGEQAQDLHHVLFEAINEDILIVGLEQVVASCNSRFSEMVKTPVEQIVESRCEQFFPAEEHAALGRLLERARSVGAKGEFSLLVADGSSLSVELSISASKLNEWGEFCVLVSDVSERKKLKNALADIENRFRLLVDAAKDCAIILLDPVGRISHWNAGAQRLLGYYVESIIGQPFTRFCLPEDIDKAQKGLENAAVEGCFEDEGWLLRKDGSRFWSREVITALRDNSGELVGYSKAVYDITERKRLEDLHAGRNRILEMIADRAALERILTVLALLIEEQSEGMLCSFLLLDEDGQHLRHGAAPSLPEPYIRAIEGESIGSRAGSCGTAVFRGELVVVTDIREDPLWTEHRNVALEHGLRACWCTPVISNDNKVLGALAMYHRQPHSPTPAEKNLGQIAADLARIAIEHQRSEEALRRSEERYRALHRDNPTMIFTVDAQGIVLSVNPFVVSRLGYSVSELEGEPVLGVVFEEDRPFVSDQLRECLQTPNQVYRWQFRKVRKDGGLLWVEELAQSVVGPDGHPNILIVCQDITERKQAEERLRRSEEFLNKVFEQSPHSMWISDEKGTFLRGNKALRDNLQVKDEELVAKYNVFKDEVVQEEGFMPLVRDVFEKRKAVRFTIEYDSSKLKHLKLARTKCLDLDITISPVLGPNGRVIHAIIQHLDITERKKAEEALRRSEERFRTMADSIPEIIFTCGADGVHDYQNLRFYEYTGLPVGSVGEEAWQKCLHPEDRASAIAKWKESVVSGQPFEMQFRLRGRNGDYSWFLTRARPIRDSKNKLVQWQGTSTDIESQKRAVEELEQQVARRTVKLQETVNELEQYSYSITHDLRAPLRAIQGFAHQLKEESAGQLPAACEEPLQRIMASTQRMEDLIRDSLNYGRLLQTAIKAEPVDIGMLIGEIIHSYPDLQEPWAEVRVEGEFPLVMGNDAGLSQCVSNLLRIAVKFVKSGTKPRVRVWAESREEWVRVWFEDNGIGITKEFQEIIFGMFQQLDKRYEGSGIGLAIVRKAVERMGGRVGVESEFGRGSRFWLDLKRAQ